MSLAGELSTFQVGRYQYPIFTSGDLSSKKCIAFIAGLDAGIGTIPYLILLSDALKAEGWKLVQFHWSGAYGGYGIGSLQDDAREMGLLVDDLEGQGVTDLVWMGNSTGCQDIATYLSSSLTFTASHEAISTVVKGGILQAPMSDREAYEHADPSGPLADDAKAFLDALSKAQEMINQGRGGELAGEEVAKAAGTRMSWDRLYSLYAKGGQDDYFSHDIPSSPDPTYAHSLSTTFGRFRVPTLALYSAEDQFAWRGPGAPTPEERMQRWAHACGPNAPLTWEVIQGADHEVTQRDAGERLTKSVIRWLGDIGLM